MTNLLTGVFLIRFASKEEYGLYGVAFSMTLLTVGVANALVMTQMTVIAPSKPDNVRVAYCGSMFLALLAVVGLAALLLLSAIFSFEEHISPQYTRLAYVFCLSFPGVVMIEYVRRYLYLTLAPRRVFFVGCLFSTIYLSTLILFYFMGTEHLHLSVLGANGLIALAVAMFSIAYFARFSLRESGRLVWGSIAESWRQGAWALGGVSVTWLQGQAYIYLLATMQGAAVVAEANAARLLLAPIGLISTSLGRVFMPRMAYLRANGKEKQTIGMAFRVLALLLSCIAVYSLLLYLGSDRIMDFFSREYESLGWLLLVWSVCVACEAIRSMPAQLLQVYRKFRIITTRNAVTAVLVVAASAIAARYGNVRGVILSMALGELLLAVLLWRGFQHAQIERG
ncbi:MAG TPA: hypothetical protein ENJ43_03995 [Gammaproteobacteria bacterium]|nr:hypothetical protein [Gammaproteobacteria bacterium]